MRKIRAIIIENDIAFQKAFSLMLHTFEEIQVLEVCSDVKAGYESITRLKPDLVFLDIELDDGNAFDLLRKIEKIDFAIVFVTAFNQYAIDAIKLSALDYLLKPFDKEALFEVISKFQKFQYEKDAVEVLMQNLVQRSVMHRTIGLRTMKGIDFVRIEDVICCKSDGNYTQFFIKDQPEVLVSENIKKFEDLLEGSNFFRVHHSYLVNVDHVVKYIKNEGGSVLMTNQMEIPISRRKKDDFFSFINDKLM